jgi:hypothetical protein
LLSVNRRELFIAFCILSLSPSLTLFLIFVSGAWICDEWHMVDKPDRSFTDDDYRPSAGIALVSFTGKLGSFNTEQTGTNIVQSNVRPEFQRP